jgi:CubicO group peptidase (beta-lactamase class C family)
MRLSPSLLIGLALYGAMTVVSPARSAEPAAVPSDTPSTTASGAAFTIPKSWSSTATAAMNVLTPPEADLHVAIVDAGAGADAKQAAAQAWAKYRPDATRTVRLVTAQPPGEGWEERQSIVYETSPNEHAIVHAAALRKGTRWTVLILDGNEATFEKRSAAASLIMQSLRPAGYSRESFVGRKPNVLDAARLETLKGFVRDSMRELGIPGASIAIVEHGSVIFEGGFGVRELGRAEPVDAHTDFMIASNTKGMSTLLLAILVDEGKLAWDQPVTQVYPSFRLGSEETTRKVLIRHLVCACTGLPRKDFEWIFNTSRNTPASNTFVLLAGTEPTSGFGEVFQYNNVMAAAAGYIGGHLVHPNLELGAAYDAAMQEKVFNPLGMHETTFDYAKALAGNHASPHSLDLNGVPTLASMDFNYTGVPTRPAGAAWSSAHDMIKYVENELALGKLPNGKRLVSEQNLLARRKPNVPVGEDGFYGMGLSGTKVGGVSVIEHGGSMMGFKSNFMLVPDAGVGAVLLTNADEGGALISPFRRRLFEILYDGKPEAAANVAAAAASMRAGMAKVKAELTVPPAPALAASLATAYSCPELGTLKVRKDGDAVYFNFGAWGTRVGSKKNPDGTTSFVTAAAPMVGLDFVVAERAGKRALVVRDGQHEYVYTET